MNEYVLPSPMVSHQRMASPTTPASGADVRKLVDILSDTVSVMQFGADHTGVADSSAAFTAAVAAAGAGGTVEVPLGTFKLNSNVTATNICFLLAGTLTGSGKIIGNESTIVRQRGDTADIESPFGVAGGGFKAHCHVNVLSTDTHADSRANLAIKRIVTGSGQNGPAYADYGIIISVEKKDWLSGAQRGESDGIYVILSQGKTDDQAGLMIHHKKVKDTTITDGTAGSTVGFECAGEWVNSSGDVLMRMQTIKNYLEGVGGWSNRTGYGFWTEARVGAPAAAFFASNVPALDWSPSNLSYIGNWQNLLVGAHSQYPGAEYFVIDGSGHLQAATGTAIKPTYGFVGDPGLGMFRPYAGYLAFSTNFEGRLVIGDTGFVGPAVDGTQPLGNASFRWGAVWAATGTIQTSDRDLKRDFRALTPAEIAAAVEIGRSIQIFRFKDAVAEKGDAAREHVGVVAQEVAEIMEAHGLQPFRYGFLCFDKWDDITKMSDPVYGYRGTGRFHDVRGERREILERYEAEPPKPVLVTPAGEKWSIRYDELSQFVLAGQAAKMAALEARLAALES